MRVYLMKKRLALGNTSGKQISGTTGHGIEVALSFLNTFLSDKDYLNFSQVFRASHRACWRPFRNSISYNKVLQIVMNLNLVHNTHFRMNKKHKIIILTEVGKDKVINAFNIYTTKKKAILDWTVECLKAIYLFKKDSDYIVKDKQVLMNGPSVSDGLHQFIEAKEGLRDLACLIGFRNLARFSGFNNECSGYFSELNLLRMINRVVELERKLDFLFRLSNLLSSKFEDFKAAKDIGDIRQIYKLPSLFFWEASEQMLTLIHNAFDKFNMLNQECESIILKLDNSNQSWKRLIEAAMNNFRNILPQTELFMEMDHAKMFNMFLSMALEISYPGSRIAKVIPKNDNIEVTINFKNQERVLSFITIWGENNFTFVEGSVVSDTGDAKADRCGIFIKGPHRLGKTRIGLWNECLTQSISDHSPFKGVEINGYMPNSMCFGSLNRSGRINSEGFLLSGLDGSDPLVDYGVYKDGRLNGDGKHLTIYNFKNGKWDDGAFDTGEILTCSGVYSTGKYKSDKLVEGEHRLNQHCVNLHVFKRHNAWKRPSQAWADLSFLRSRVVTQCTAHLKFDINPAKILKDQGSRCLVNGPVTYKGGYSLKDCGPSGHGEVSIPGLPSCFKALNLDPKTFQNIVVYEETENKPCTISGTWENGNLFLEKGKNKTGIVIKIYVDDSSIANQRHNLYIGGYIDRSLTFFDDPWFEESPTGGIQFFKRPVNPHQYGSGIQLSSNGKSFSWKEFELNK
ncbi:hypothetical protein DID76_02890 [Candidatus Marinamargulisbacteria bacterium SCGC AG-414-C22]|nr:hypothetical protein DID76_02890 [Candidatus Marinamargulisbacteria bacterium SCGC AG-414-C22]